MTCNDTTCNQEREAKMVRVGEYDGKLVFCDPCIAPIVKALNDAGIKTIASCCGHGHRPPSIILADHSWLIIAKDIDEAKRINALFPTDINGDPTTA